MLKIKRFVKNYNGNPALKIPDLEIPPGIHWLKGKNGAGKSTFFRSLAGMVPFEGELWLNDAFEINRDKSEYRQRVNYGEAEPFYPPFLRAAELIDFVALAKNAGIEQTKSLGNLLGTLSFESQTFQTFSSGMLKKTSLLLAFLGNPHWILLDEPLITLDHDTSERLFELILSSRQQGISFLISSHEESIQERLPVDRQYLAENQTIRLCP